MPKVTFFFIQKHKKGFGCLTGELSENYMKLSELPLTGGMSDCTIHSAGRLCDCIVHLAGATCSCIFFLLLSSFWPLFVSKPWGYLLEHAFIHNWAALTHALVFKVNLNWLLLSDLPLTCFVCLDLFFCMSTTISGFGVIICLSIWSNDERNWYW